MTVPSANRQTAPLLSIGIPTFNRARYLQDLLLELERQIQENSIPVADVQILVSDNASSDTTSAVVLKIAARLPHLRYIQQPQNIGAGRNIITCVREARGMFCWVCGDDELLQAGGLKALLGLLKKEGDVSLVINLRPKYVCSLPRPARFANYYEYALACALKQPHVLIEHTLVSANVFQTSLFDPTLGEAKVGTSFPHMYALLEPVIDQGGPVVLPAFPLIEVRDRRPPFAEWPVDLEQSWRDYLGWQKRKMSMSELNPEQAINQVRRELLHKITRHPLQYLTNNAKAVLKPGAWRFIASRLWRYLFGRPPRDAHLHGKDNEGAG